MLSLLQYSIHVQLLYVNTLLCVYEYVGTCAQYLKHTLTSSLEVLLQRRVAKR